jgi:hypothetical protein
MRMLLYPTEAVKDLGHSPLRLRCATATVALLCGMLCGCGGAKDAPKSVPIKGMVTYKDQPISRGEVVYTPAKDGAGRMHCGGISPDGTFQLRTSPSVPGVCRGIQDQSGDPGRAAE